MSGHYYIPDYVLGFQCAMCSACCRRWRINIDPATAKKYAELAASDRKMAGLLKSLKKDHEEKMFIQLRPREKDIPVKKISGFNGSIPEGKMIAPCLTDEGLCSIQLEYGLEALSDLCKAFPRIVFKTERGWEMALSYACPTAARTLQQKESVVFYQDPPGFSFPSLNSQFEIIGNTAKREKAGKADYFTVEKTMIEIMQLRDLNVDERLNLAGYVLSKYEESGRQEDITGIFLNARQRTGGTPDRSLNGFGLAPLQPLLMIKLIRQAMTKRLFAHIPDTDISRLFGKAGNYHRLQGDPAGLTGEKALYFLVGYEKYYEPYLNNLSCVYENYFVNFIFSKKYYVYKYLEAYQLMFFYYNMLRFFTVCACLAREQPADGDALVRVIHLVGRALGHATEFHHDILDVMRETGTLLFKLLRLPPVVPPDPLYVSGN